jgi:hypothetical protein
MAMSNTAKLGIAAAAVGGIFLLTRKSKADEPSKTESKASELGDVAGCAAGTADAKSGKAKADMDKQAALALAAFKGSGLTTTDMLEFTLAFTAAYDRCYTENKVSGGGGKTFIKFDPAKAPDPVNAQLQARLIGTTKALSSVPASAIAVPPYNENNIKGTYRTLSDYCTYDGTLIKKLQTSAGIDVDGKCGPETQKAFLYYWNLGPISGTA